MKKSFYVLIVLIISVAVTVAQDTSKLSEITPDNISQLKEIYTMDINIPVSDPIMMLFANLIDIDVENKLALVGYGNDQNVMWDMTTKSQLYEVVTPNVSVTATSSYLIKTDYAKGITQIADKRTGEAIAYIKGIMAIFSQDDSLMAIADDRFVNIIETQAWSTLFSFSYRSVNSLNFCPDNSCLVVSDFYRQGLVDYWDLTVPEPTKKELIYRTNPEPDIIVGTYLPFTSDGVFLLIQESTKLYVWDISKEELHSIKDATNVAPLEKQYVTVYPYKEGENERFFDIASNDDLAEIPYFNRIVWINPTVTVFIACEISCKAIDMISGEILVDNLPFDGFEAVFGTNYITDIDDTGSLVIFGVE